VAVIMGDFADHTISSNFKIKEPRNLLLKIFTVPVCMDNNNELQLFITKNYIQIYQP
jgi:hypothetical protein